MPVSPSPHLSEQHMGKPTGKSAVLLDVRKGPWQRGETRWWAATTQPCSTSAATPGQGPCGSLIPSRPGLGQRGALQAGGEQSKRLVDQAWAPACTG